MKVTEDSETDGNQWVPKLLKFQKEEKLPVQG